MKKLTATSLSLLLAMSSGQSIAKEFVLTDNQEGIAVGNWSISSEKLNIRDKSFKIENKVLSGGKQQGSEVITITSGDFSVSVSPTRGMNILSAKGNGVRMGWDSPVDEVVNPAYINLESRGGHGWLDGFNEMMVRCGFEWTGHAVVADGRVYSLHGRAGNTPASKVVINIDEKAPYTISIRGLIKENTFKNSNLEVQTELRYIPGTQSFTIHDVLINKSDYAKDYQIIYHSNFGTPILEEGAQFSAPVKEISPFNKYAATGLKEWKTYLGPTKNFDEMVFNLILLADSNDQTLAMVSNKANDKAAVMEFNVKQLPVLSLWKNTDTLKQGYVTGIEPGTSFAYPVTIERKQGRVKQLQPGEQTEFTITYSLLTNNNDVNNYQQRINNIQKQAETTIIEKPMVPE